MSNEELSHDAYAREPVPEEKTVSAIQVSLVIIGGTISVPAFLMASEVATARGLGGAIPAFLLGTTILAILAVLCGIVGTEKRLSTYMIARDSFGHQGAKLVAAVIATALFGWFAVLAGVFGGALNQVVLDIFSLNLPASLYMVIGAILFMSVTIFGFSAIDKFAIVIVPAMFGLIIYTAWYSLKETTLDTLLAANSDDMTFGVAVSAVVGMYVIGAITNPDYTRYARSRWHGIFASILGLGISFPIVLIMAAIPSVVTAERDMIQIMIAVGIGLPALFMLIFSTWSSNALVLYSASLSAATIVHKLRYWQIVVLFGVFGSVLAIIGVMDYFVPFLVTLGVAIPPIAAIYVSFYFLAGKEAEPKAFHLPALVAWVMGFATGYATSQELFSLSGVPSLDAILAALTTYLVFKLAIDPAHHQQTHR